MRIQCTYITRNKPRQNIGVINRSGFIRMYKESLKRRIVKICEYKFLLADIIGFLSITVIKYRQ